MSLLAQKLALGPFWWRSRPSAPGTWFSLTRAGGTPINIILQSILGNSKKSPEFEIELQCSQLSCVNSVGLKSPGPAATVSEHVPRWVGAGRAGTGARSAPAIGWGTGAGWARGSAGGGAKA